jgi:dihydrodipicolinate synthase/N-acetylneuraminate lyase
LDKGDNREARAGEWEGASAAGRLGGVMLPFPTPFDARGELDLGGLRENVSRWNETGVAGYVALGSTGERVHLDESEVSKVVGAARDAVPREMIFVVGVGQQSARPTRARTPCSSSRPTSTAPR